MFANGPEDRDSISGPVIPKTQKIVLDAALINTQHYKVWIKDKVEQSRETSSTLLYASVFELLKREPLGHPLLRSAKFTLLLGQILNKNKYLNCKNYGILTVIIFAHQKY